MIHTADHYQNNDTIEGLILGYDTYLRRNHVRYGHFPFWAIYYLHPQLLQNHDWSYRQALSNTLFRIYLRTVSAIQMHSGLSPEPLKEGDSRPTDQLNGEIWV